jgi:hypothetical protein
MLMLVKVRGGTPDQLIARIRGSVAGGLVKGWRCNEKGKLTLSDRAWSKKGWLIMAAGGDDSVLIALELSSAKLGATGVFFGRCTALLLDYFNTNVRAIAVVRPEDLPAR